jgi:hypothetical protein
MVLMDASEQAADAWLRGSTSHEPALAPCPVPTFEFGIFDGSTYACTSRYRYRDGPLTRFRNVCEFRDQIKPRRSIGGRSRHQYRTVRLIHCAYPDFRTIGRLNDSFLVLSGLFATAEENGFPRISG